MATPNATITKNIALAPDGWKRTAFPDGSVPNAGPSAPPTFTTSKTSSSITATITNANGATSYNVRVNTGAAVAGLTVSGLAAETAYSFQVQGVNEFGSSDWSTAVSVTTDAAATGGGTGDISWTGIVAHGQVLTITDAQSRFGTRTNVKPLYVNTGGGKTDTALGRDTANRFPAAATYQTAIKNGSVPGAVGLDHFNNSVDAVLAGILIDAAKPFIAYLERYYAFNIADPAYQGAQGFNLKPFRIWAGDDASDLYYAYQGSEGQNSCRYFVENVWGGGADYYVAPQVAFAWFEEEILFFNSDPDVENGIFEHYRNNQGPLNDVLAPETRSGTRLALTEVNLDQVSNGVGQSSITYLGYTCFDDEYNGAYLGNASTRSACTKLVRLPQTAWAPGQISAHLIESQVTLAGAHLYFRTGKSSWVSDTGVALS